jgi:tetratricopeptide (TPR) repeat protein
MKARLGWVVVVAGAGAIALSAAAQGSAKLAVGPDAGGYLCPDGRQLYVKSCYDDLPDANCGVVNMHLPAQNGFQRVTTETRSKLTPSVAACKVYPLEFRNDGTVALVVPKSAPPAQTAEAPAAQPNAAAKARLDFLEQAEMHFSNLDFELAIPFYERAMELDPKDVETAEQICTLYVLSDAPPEKGVIACERLLKLNPKNLVRPHQAIAELQMRKGDNRKALASAMAWAGLEPQESLPWATLTKIYVALGRNQEALSAVQKAVNLEPKDIATLAQRGDVFRRLGRFEESIADYRTALVLWPENPEQHHGLADSLRAAGRKTEADAEQRLAIDFALSHGRNALKKPGDGSPVSFNSIFTAKEYLEMLDKWDKSAAAKLAAEIKAAER